MTPIKVLRTERLLPHVRMDSHALHTKDVYGTLLPFVATTFSL
jgi:hypothetical protein